MNKGNGIIFILTAVGASLLFLYFQSDERKVSKRFSTLAELVSKEGGESVVVLATRARGIGKLFHDPCTVEASDQLHAGSYTPEKITSRVASARTLFKTLSLKFYDLNITFPTDGLARVRLTGMLSGQTKQEELFEETHEMEVDLTKVEGEWFFSRLQAVQVLER